ncbi:MAG: hypothetical protein JAY97_20465, partial [Candidatus Thiodiazotropha sp. 'RUGA']|nr:hypothetical protein [Candidatus Thiodiazotropha sp. 'RUGA']
GEGDTYHVGRFVDRRGSAHWLVIREAVIKTWQREDDMPSVVQADASFYEVVTDPELISKVKKRLNAKRAPNQMEEQQPEEVIPLSLESDS